MDLALLAGQLHGPGKGPPISLRLSDKPKLLRGKHEGYNSVQFNRCWERKKEHLVWSMAVSSEEWQGWQVWTREMQSEL